MKELEEILTSPKLPEYYQRIRQQLENEKEKRKQFLENIDENTNAEFINGQVIYHSPVSYKHSLVSDFLFSLLHFYVIKNGLGVVRHEKIMLQFERNNYEPDIAFWRKEKAKDFRPEQLLFPPPDFIVEILSPSTEKYDRGVKLEDYAYHGVEEYWIIDPTQEIIWQYINNNGRYDLVKQFHKEFITSFVVKGFKIPASAIFDERENLRALRVL